MTPIIKKDLASLEASGLIRLAQVGPELTYQFHHALIQNAVYDTLLKKDRKRIHDAVGQSL
jgi:predicted ATPase